MATYVVAPALWVLLATVVAVVFCALGRAGLREEAEADQPPARPHLVLVERPAP